MWKCLCYDEGLTEVLGRSYIYHAVRLSITLKPTTS